MTIGRLGINKPYQGLEYHIAPCGCKILETPVVSLTWYAKDCKCVCCDTHECKCEDWSEDENS